MLVEGRKIITRFGPPQEYIIDLEREVVGWIGLFAVRRVAW
jgi:hypothetical protein